MLWFDNSFPIHKVSDFLLKRQERYKKTGKTHLFPVFDDVVYPLKVSEGNPSGVALCTRLHVVREIGEEVETSPGFYLVNTDDVG